MQYDFNQSLDYRKNRAVIWWLCAGLVMLIIQIVLGAITRLTGSGLSITEWKPLLGAIPPLTELEWNESFEKYQQIAQFKKVNSHFILSDYKSIFFWEWFHREWARLMGLVFIVPFLFFMASGKIKRDMVFPMLVLFLLGALQGFVGWVMVKSGLNDTDIVVSHIRLAIHFVCALILLVYVLKISLFLAVPKEQTYLDRKLRRWFLALIVLLAAQMFYGAFMAGSHAALNAATWPDINGSIFPYELSIWQKINNWFYDPLLIQFAHRGLAYLITVFVLVIYLKTRNLPKHLWLYKFRGILVFIVLLQVFLGVWALLNSMYSWMIYYAVIHQFVGIVFLLLVFTGYYLCKPLRRYNKA